MQYNGVNRKTTITYTCKSYSLNNHPISWNLLDSRSINDRSVTLRGVSLSHPFVLRPKLQVQAKVEAARTSCTRAARRILSGGSRKVAGRHEAATTNASARRCIHDAVGKAIGNVGGLTIS